MRYAILFVYSVDDSYHAGTDKTSLIGGDGFNWDSSFTLHLFHSVVGQYFLSVHKCRASNTATHIVAKVVSTAISKYFPLIGCACTTCFSGPLLNDAARLEEIMFLVKENKQLTNFAQACVKALGYQDALRFLAQVVLHCGTDNDPDCNAWDTDKASDEMSEANMKAKEKDSDTFGFSDLRTKW